MGAPRHCPDTQHLLRLAVALGANGDRRDGRAAAAQLTLTLRLTGVRVIDDATLREMPRFLLRRGLELFGVSPTRAAGLWKRSQQSVP